MSQLNQFYLVVDRNDPRRPRWVIAQAWHSRPAVTPDILDGPGAAWLSEFGPDEFGWLAAAFDRDIGLRVPQPGTEGFATRIVDWTNVWREHHYRDDALYEGWPGTWGDDGPAHRRRP